ncbi:hypothetical protein UT300019_18680 [Clostridium sp. CTA-19]
MLKIGIVNEFEKNELLRMYEKRLAIEELSYSINDITINDCNLDVNSLIKIKEKMEKDYYKNEEMMEKWWKITSEKYNWENNKDKKWSLNFETNIVSLI